MQAIPRNLLKPYWKARDTKFVERSKIPRIMKQMATRSITTQHGDCGDIREGTSPAGFRREGGGGGA